MSAGTPPGNGASPGAAGDRARRPTVLLADDDAGLRGMLRTALGGAGFEVEAVPDGDAARAAYLRGCPDILLADLVMPGLNGQELAAACRARCPDTVIVFMSGYSPEDLQKLEIRQVVFLSKPISPRELVETLRRLLDARRERRGGGGRGGGGGGGGG